MSPAGSGILLDSSVIIDHFRGDPRIGEALEGAAALYLPTIVLGELYYGAFRSAFCSKQLDQIRRFLRAAVVIGTDSQTSEVYGRIRSDLASTGHQIPENDVWVAAIARQHGLPLATRDRHFGRVAGIEVRFW